jgi:hypothetical protein
MQACTRTSAISCRRQEGDNQRNPLSDQPEPVKMVIAQMAEFAPSFYYAVAK